MELDIFAEDQPTVVEYARFHGLSTDYTQEKPPLPIKDIISDETIAHDANDPFGAPPVTNTAKDLTKEPLRVSREAVLLLKAVYSLSEPSNEELPDRRLLVLGSKQELPLLQSDHELDMLRFGSTATPMFDDLRIPLEPLHEHDEWSELSSTQSAAAMQYRERAESEKLQVTSDTLHFLQTTIKTNLESPQADDLVGGGLKHEKNPPVQPLTPPLLPLTPPLTPYIPSSPADYLPLLSEDSNSTAFEARALEHSIMEMDAPLQVDIEDSVSMLMEMPDADLSGPASESYGNQNKRKAEDWRVEGPLTPPMFSESPAKRLKSVSFSAMVQYIPELPSTYENGDHILCPEDDFAGFYPDKMIEETQGRIASEKLSEADTTKRVDVPYLDFTLPVAPWDNRKRRITGNGTTGPVSDAQTGSLAHIKRSLTKGTETWHGVSKLERELCWDPMPAHSVKVTIVETLHGDENLGTFIPEMNESNVVTSSSSIWNGDRLRIFDHDENQNEEEELDLAKFEQQEDTQDLGALIKKRKLDMEDADIDAKHRRKEVPTWSTSRNKSPANTCKSNESHHWSGGATTRHVPLKSQAEKHSFSLDTRQAPVAEGTSQSMHDSNNLMFGGKFSASNALDNFMALQGISVQPPKANKHRNHVPAKGLKASLPVHSNTPTANPVEPSSNANIEPVHPPTLPIQLPSIPKNLPQCSFIISSALLQQRTLTKPIEQLYPHAEFVSRDFTLPHSSTQEADLLLSPSTGLIITTLQQVKQRALPGQPDHSPLKQRISTLQLRYERLVVMITEGLTREMEAQGTGRPVDSRDREAIAAIETFTARMQAEVLVRYVPGGEQTLARCIVREMATYSLPHGSQDIEDIKPLADETNWELFLRRAGFNPFAAQVILAWLKDTIDYPLESSSPTRSFDDQMRTIQTYGLQRFLVMSAEERVQSFQAVLGGSRVLRRVCALLDMEWVSAAHGYRM